MAEGPSLADLGEWELIRRLGAFAPCGQFGDDAALLELAGKGAQGPGQTRLVVTTDVLVEGVHFSEATTDAGDVGWRCAAANLSDLAAMGCSEVLGLTVALVAPPSTPWPWVEGVYGGLKAVLDRYGGQLLGGDCSSGAQRLLAITALGRLESGAGMPVAGPIHRGDGRAGDQLLSSGPHGLSRLGLALLLGHASVEQLDLRRRAISAHRRPRPRLDAVPILAACRPPDRPWRVGGCDSSDGLAAAVAAVARASGCGALLERGALPMDPAMACLPEAEPWCLSGGEDFELVLALEPEWAYALVRQLPGASLIGELTLGSPGDVRWADSRELLGETHEGFCHFH